MYGFRRVAAFAIVVATGVSSAFGLELPGPDAGLANAVVQLVAAALIAHSAVKPAPSVLESK